ncbi:hypothetical protein MNBD_GAMMA08-606 [hydrothermal vent metagenome]|uniref:DUF4124 domain-containing protein n=1 Tax=hydrothermal vent metagenome TaxID=652676 RepID=A0A3B0WWJ9_9ZZZZ
MFIKKPHLFHLFLSGLFASLLLMPNAFAGLHKWTDENGQVHYGDRVPSKYLRKEHYQLNEQGVTINTSEKLKTEKEESAAQLKNKIKAAEDRKRLIAARKKALRDRVLLDTFTTEKDLSLARDARIEAIDSQLSLAETLIKNDEERLGSLKKRIESIEKASRKAPENLHKEVASISRQIESNYAYVEDKTNERDEIIKTFKQDVIRFRALKKAKLEAKNK